MSINFNDIIERLGLKKVDMVHGASFVNQIQFYEWKPGIYLAQCDFHGNKIADDRMTVFNSKGKSKIVTMIMLASVPVDILEKTLLS